MQIQLLTSQATLPCRITLGDKPRSESSPKLSTHFIAPAAFLPLGLSQKNLSLLPHYTSPLEAYRLCLLMSLKPVHPQGYLFNTEVCAGFLNDFVFTPY